MSDTYEMLRVRLYEGQDDDLLAWYGALVALPHGAKSQAIKEVLRRGLGGASSQPVGAPGLYSGAPQERDELLADLRRIVEAALETSLSRLALPRMLEETAIREGADDIEALLDGFADSLFLGEE